MEIPIADAGDERLRDYTDLTDVALRRVREPEQGLFMAESLAVIDRALAAGYRPHSILTEQRWLPAVQALLVAHGATAPCYVAGSDVITRTTGFRMHRGPMAAMARLPLPSAADVVAGAKVVVVLDGLVDHTNVGAAFRSAAGLGASAVLVTPTCADPLYRRSVRVSMGTVFTLPWTTSEAWDRDLTGFTTLALTPTPDAVDLADVVHQVQGPAALVVGTEGPGLSDEAQTRADIRVRIPMAHGVDSLNVAASVAVATYALCHR